MEASRVYRGTRRVVMAAVFVVAAAFFAGVAILSAGDAGTPTTPANLVWWLIVALFVAFASRFLFMRAVATPDGLKVHGPLGTASFGWDEIVAIQVADTETDATWLTVRAPVLLLASGLSVEVTPAATYRRSAARRMAGELEALRRLHTT
ncbi:MAG TPA: hypothetical protein VIP77_19325 [Jiangellaceae bacterium]